MQKLTLRTTALILMLIFYSCSHNNLTVDDDVLKGKDEDLLVDDSQKKVEIRATFKGMTVSSDITTRITNNNWDSSDAIGVFMKSSANNLSVSCLEENVKYIATGNSDRFSSNKKIYFPINNEQVDFIAYYPYVENINDLKYEIDVSELNIHHNAEFMYSDNAKKCCSQNSTVNLEFHPQLVKLIVKIHDFFGGEKLNLDENNINVKAVDLHTKANFNLSSGLFEILPDENYISDINFNNNGTEAEALLLPVETLTDKVLVVKTKDKTYSLALDSIYCDGNIIESLVQSQQYNFSIYLTGSDIDGSISATISDREEVIVDKIVLPEDSVSEDEIDNPESPNEDGGTNEGNSDSGENNEDENSTPDDTDNSDNGNNNPDSPNLEGDGTKANPYSIAQINNMKDVELKKIWIKGYIVGSYTSLNPFDTFTTEKPEGSNGSNRNLALAVSPNEKCHEATLPVYLMGTSTLKYIANKLNLKDNYDNLGKELLLQGDIETWNNGSSSSNITPRTSVTEIYKADIL